MKKTLLALSMFIILFSFSGCVVNDVMVDDITAHNGLVMQMDAVLDSEEQFYNVYYDLAEGDDVNVLRDNYNVFNESVIALDSYFSDTAFASFQQVFIDEYQNSYSGFVSDYVAYAGEFVSALESKGVTLDVITEYVDTLDGYALDFVDVHNALIETINLQSDEV